MESFLYSAKGRHRPSAVSVSNKTTSDVVGEGPCLRKPLQVLANSCFKRCSESNSVVLAYCTDMIVLEKMQTLQ